MTGAGATVSVVVGNAEAALKIASEYREDGYSDIQVRDEDGKLVDW